MISLQQMICPSAVGPYPPTFALPYGGGPMQYSPRYTSSLNSLYPSITPTAIFPPLTLTNYYQKSFFPRTITDWNNPNELIECSTLDEFLYHLKFL